MTAGPVSMSRESDDAEPAAPPLRLPANIADALLAQTVAFGRRDLETGGFLLIGADDDDPGGTVQALALAGDHGVERGWGRFTVSGAVLENMCEWAADNELRAAALVHTHKRTAGMSWIDRESGFRVDGFRSVIVPWFTNPPPTPNAWGWYVFRDNDWQRDQPGQIVPGDHGRVVVIDERGVR
jgi:hypothetical protein